MKEEEHHEKINEWLNLGARALAEDNFEEANLLYFYLKKEYEPIHDPTKHFYKKILEFYQELTKLSEKK